MASYILQITDIIGTKAEELCSLVIDTAMKKLKSASGEYLNVVFIDHKRFEEDVPTISEILSQVLTRLIEKVGHEFLEKYYLEALSKMPKAGLKTAVAILYTEYKKQLGITTWEAATPEQKKTLTMIQFIKLAMATFTNKGKANFGKFFWSILLACDQHPEIYSQIRGASESMRMAATNQCMEINYLWCLEVLRSKVLRGSQNTVEMIANLFIQIADWEVDESGLVGKVEETLRMFKILHMIEREAQKEGFQTLDRKFVNCRYTNLEVAVEAWKEAAYRQVEKGNTALTKRDVDLAADRIVGGMSFEKLGEQMVTVTRACTMIWSQCDQSDVALIVYRLFSSLNGKKPEPIPDFVPEVIHK